MNLLIILTITLAFRITIQLERVEDLRMFKIHMRYDEYIILFPLESLAVIDEREIDKVISEFSRNSFYQNMTIHLYAVPVNFMELHFKEMFEIKETIIFYIHKKMKVFKQSVDFFKLIGKGNSSKAISLLLNEFQEMFHSPSQLLCSMTEIEKKVSSGEIVGIFVGEHDHNYRMFLGYTHKVNDFTFYHCFDKNLKGKLLYKYNKRYPFDKDLFFLILPENFDKEFSTERLLFTEVFYSDIFFKSFMDYERYPILRDPSFLEININNFSQNKNLILLFVRPNLATTMFEDFKYALKGIHKRLIISWVYEDSTEFLAYNRLITDKSTILKPNGAYIMIRVSEDETYVKEFKKQMSVEALKTFVNYHLIIQDKLAHGMTIEEAERAAEADSVKKDHEETLNWEDVEDEL